MKIGIDIDGVILDFERTMNSYAELYDLLILGKSGVGKSEAALELVKRGHRLVADDIVEIKKSIP